MFPIAALTAPRSTSRSRRHGPTVALTERLARIAERDVAPVEDMPDDEALPTIAPAWAASGSTANLGDLAFWTALHCSG